MKTRLIAAVVALVLALVGTVILVSYVAGADRRALAGTQTVDVLVVSKTVPKGTPSQDVAELVRLEAVPRKVVAKDSVTSLKDLGGMVTTVELVPGEQLLSSRFVEAKSLRDKAQGGVPAGMQELTVQLDPQRVVGGMLQAGDTVGVFVSGGEPARTRHVFHAVLVTNVQGAPAPPDAKTGGTAAPVPAGALLVTLAARARDAVGIVWGMEFGKVWLSKEPKEADDSGTKVAKESDVLR